MMPLSNDDRRRDYGEAALLTLVNDPRKRDFRVTVFSRTSNDKYVIRAEEVIRAPGRGGRIVLHQCGYTAWPAAQIQLQ
jgi:hypothetical protein